MTRNNQHNLEGLFFNKQSLEFIKGVDLYYGWMGGGGLKISCIHSLGYISMLLQRHAYLFCYTKIPYVKKLYI